MNRSRNGGFTLVELLVTITIGIIVTFAATTVLLLCLRVHNQSSATATQQNEIRMGITVMENILAENEITGVTEHEIKYSDGSILYDEDTDSISTDKGVAILSDVTSCKFDLNDSLLTYELEIHGVPYSSSVYCRLANVPEVEPDPEEGDAISAVSDEPDENTLILEAVNNPDTSWQIRKFLSNLTSQLGSTGRIQTEAGEEKYYSEWYIGSYEKNPGWSGDTPWCACYVSWALEESGGCLKGATPRFANVDSFWADFVTTERWKTEDPMPGDVIFFDWIADESYNPQHVGVVLTVRNGWVYTIEGNSNGKVAVCKYAPDDPHILGYGLLNWN